MCELSRIKYPALCLLAIVIVIGLRPGDSSWFFDMSHDFEVALKYNATACEVAGISLPFTPAPFGIAGTHGILYGPLPIWVDQLFLAFTRNLVVMTEVRAVVVAGMIAVALLWLTRVAGVSPWLAVVAMLSPWLWYYSRQLWDNSLLVPITAILFVSYGQFLKTPGAWAICIVVVCAALACLVHLIAVPLIAAIVLHAVCFEWRSVRRFKWEILVTVMVMLVISAPYLRYLLTFHGSHIPNDGPAVRSWLFPLFGAQHLTAQQIGYLLEEDWPSILPGAVGSLFAVACLVSCIGYLASWIGMVAAIPKAWRAFRLGGSATILEKLSLVSLAVLVFQTVFDGVEHVWLYPHYHNTTWIIYVLFVWIAFDSLGRRVGERSSVVRAAVSFYAASLLFVVVVVAWQIARNGGMKGNHYNAVLSNQIEVARRLAEFSPDSPVDVRVSYWRQEPRTLPVLREIVAPVAAGPQRQVVVRFRDAFPGDARIVVEDYPLASEAAIAP